MISCIWRPCGEPSVPEVIGGVGGQVETLQVAEHELVWVDVCQPQTEDIAWLERTFGFHQLALEDVAVRHQRPKLDEYPGYYFGVLYALRTRSDEHAWTPVSFSSSGGRPTCSPFTPRPFRNR